MTNFRTLEFAVDKQRLTKKRDCDFSRIVAGTDGYLRAKFYFSEEWEGCAKIATFEADTDDGTIAMSIILDIEDSCDIPSAVLKSERFYIQVIGGKTKPGNNARAMYKITTNKTKVKQVEVK